MITLSNATLNDLPQGVTGPSYDRAALSPGIVHIGLGNFHRAHQSWYLHRLMQQGQALDWAIIGAGVRAYDEAQRLKLAAQDYLTTLIELSPTGTSAEVVGSMIGYVPIVDGNGPLIAQMADPAIRIVALTVTEGGYYIDPVTKGFDTGHPDIQHDAAYPDTPRTAFGAMVAALKKRRDSGAGPFTGQSCDNLQGNGAILRQVVVSLAQMTDPGLASWIDSNCSFPNSMVDCIVPATGPAELAQAHGFGIEDAAPVTHEDFRQWVIEDHFAQGRPVWDAVGAQMVRSVEAHELMKLRCLNGTHSTLAYLGYLAGYETISDTVADPAFAALCEALWHDEILPTLPEPEGEDLAAYTAALLTRYRNPAIRHRTWQIAMDGSQKLPQRLLGTIRDNLVAGHVPHGLCLAVAGWMRYVGGVDETGAPIDVRDPMAERLRAATDAGETPEAKVAALLKIDEIFGYDLPADNGFQTAVTEAFLSLVTHGAVATVRTRTS